LEKSVRGALVHVDVKHKKPVGIQTPHQGDHNNIQQSGFLVVDELPSGKLT